MVALYVTIAIGRSAAFPFLPLFFIELGVRPVSHVELWSGATIGLQFFMAALFSPIWGAVGDRVGRKAMVLRSCVALSLSSGLVAVATQAWEVLALRLISGSFSGFSAAATALVASNVPEEYLGFSLGWLASAQVVGSLFGPLLGGLLADHVHDYRIVFALSSGFSLVIALACGIFLEDDPAVRRAAALRRPMPYVQQIREVALHPNLAPMLAVVLLAQVCALGLQPVVSLFVRSLVSPQWLATAAGAAVAVTGVADIIFSPFLGKRSDRIGYRRVLLISLAGAACFTLPQSLAGTIWVFLALRFGVGMFLGGILPTANALIGSMFPAHERGRVYGVTQSATYIGMALGPLIGASIAARFGFHAVFILIGSLMLLNFAWVASTVHAPLRLTGNRTPERD